MTREEIILQFQGGSETAPVVYTFNGTLTQLKEAAGTTIRTLSVNGVLHFVSTDENYTPTDARMEVL